MNENDLLRLALAATETRLLSSTGTGAYGIFRPERAGSQKNALLIRACFALIDVFDFSKLFMNYCPNRL